MDILLNVCIENFNLEMENNEQYVIGIPKHIKHGRRDYESVDY